MNSESLVTTDNAAGRAYYILKHASNAGAQTQTKRVWAETFGVSENDPVELRYRLSLLIAQLGEAQHAFYKLGDHQFDDPFPAFIAATANPNWEQPWQSISTAFSRPALTALALASSLTSKADDLASMEADQLAELDSTIGSLLGEIVESEIEGTLKNVITEHLHSVRTAILYYRLHGSEGLRKATLAAWGALVVNGAQLRDEDPKNEGPIRRVFDFLKQLSTLLKVAKDIKTLAPTVTALLSSGS